MLVSRLYEAKTHPPLIAPGHGEEERLIGREHQAIPNQESEGRGKENLF
jgi:hypothetical protein